MSTQQNEDIRELSPREQCRMKLPVFYGSRDNFYHGALETLMNGNDIIKNKCNGIGKLQLLLHEDNETISVADSGTGIPLMGENSDGIKNYELLFLRLFAGTNYQNLEQGKTTTGTNGCGATVLNYSSVLYEAYCVREGMVYYVKFKDGGELVEYKEKKACDVELPFDIEQGTIITFKLDKDVYTSTKFDVKELKAVMNRLSSNSPNIEYVVKYNGETFVYNYDSIKSYLELNQDSAVSSTFEFPQKECKVGVEKDGEVHYEINTIKACISLSTNPVQQTFLNSTFLKEGGAIYDRMVDRNRKSLAKDLKRVKPTAQDIVMSFNFYCSIYSTNVEIANQTKLSTNKALYKTISSAYIQERLESFKIEEPKIWQQMLDHITKINTLNAKTEGSIKAIKKQLEEKSTNCITRPAKLVPCRSKDPSKISVAFLEGDSALNSVKLGRDSETMMVYPWKGKPLNAMKASLDRILQNQEIIDMYRIFGCGMEYKGKQIKGFDKFDIKKLLVKEILIITDQDEDGAHLQVLGIGDIYTLSPELIKHGIVKVLLTPLYIIHTKSEGEIWAYSEMERRQIVDRLIKENKQYKEQRFKGIGGLDVDIMNKCLDPATRKVITITMEQGEESARLLKLFLEDDVEPRRKYIEEHAKDYTPEEIYV